MHRKFALVIGSALLAGFALAAPSYAQEQKTPAMESQHDHGIPSNMMARMNKMMDGCAAMMESQDMQTVGTASAVPIQKRPVISINSSAQSLRRRR